MCGIIGYIGKKEAAPILLDGLKRLEYRGYDSAGLVVIERSTNQVVDIKAVGRVDFLEKEMSDKTIRSDVGIAHTRWATHGQPSVINAHPHSDCQRKIWLVHNGIIENHQELKAELQRSGHQFKSETDSEVLVHLIEQENKTKSLLEAVRSALRKIRGTYGLVVLSSDEPDKIIAARNSSPLLIGVGDGENLIASDAGAIAAYTRKVIYLSDGEIAVVTKDGVEISTMANLSVAKEVQQIDWEIGEASREGFAHFMLKEISEQPESIANSLRGRLVQDEGRAKLGGLEFISDELRKIEKLIIVACGTAYFAGKVGEYMIEEYAGVPTEVDYASEFRYRKPLIDKRTALLAISQSGETADTLAAVKEAKQKGALTLGIVNTVGSSITRETAAGVYNHAGPEIGVASTKAFTSQLAVLVLLTLFLGRQRQLSLVMGKRIAEELALIPAKVKQILQQANVIKELTNKYSGYKNFLFLGRKYNFPTAREGALKLKEISYLHAEGYAAGEMKHGPIALIDKNFPTVAIVLQDSVYNKVLSNIEEIKSRGGPVLAIATSGNQEISKIVDDVIYIPKTLEILSPILAVISLQLFAYYMGRQLGYDVDKPRNLAKSVTVE